MEIEKTRKGATKYKKTKMKHKTIQLIILTDLSNEEVLQIINNGTDNLKELGILLEEIRVVGKANSIIKGISYENLKEVDNKKLPRVKK